eukprot:CAMPEP_0198323424 /NCGR_PEP_ID=MMETSP1450-20131203/11668_1 /TAXON_ID=753684 ORGANISM="Madagascaria erythrocladiodes, Strain CCMP3234" /NCGR_SAMPLE_ID=MMETSP1450 /ASSEMBLY_ACC=CAM_ASM_001115 /LENGTH=172 /DNA_ID=CAMNT_0044027121 /DNA_START=550 /DNA_END=1069 /DNA_ORIENTATION=-
MRGDTLAIIATVALIVVLALLCIAIYVLALFSKKKHSERRATPDIEEGVDTTRALLMIIASDRLRVPARVSAVDFQLDIGRETKLKCISKHKLEQVAPRHKITKVIAGGLLAENGESSITVDDEHCPVCLEEYAVGRGVKKLPVRTYFTAAVWQDGRHSSTGAQFVALVLLI